MPHRLPRAQWPTYFKAYASGLAQSGGVHYGELRILEDGRRKQLQPRWLPVRTICYDRTSDELTAFVDHLGDIRRRPLRFLVDERGVIRLEVSRSDGIDEIIELR